MKVLLDNATLQVGLSPGIRVLHITDPGLPWLELEVVLSSFNAAEAARHLMQGEPEQESGLRVVDANGVRARV